MTGCDRLDDFLCDNLSDAERGQFEAHLSHCDSCQAAVAEDRQIDRFIARVQPPTPPSLIDRIENRIQRIRWRRRIGVGLAAAASLAFVAFLIGKFDGTNGTPLNPTVAESEPARPSEALPVHVTFAPTDHVIAVPRVTDNPRVTIVWIYSTDHVVSNGRTKPPEAGSQPKRREI